MSEEEILPTEEVVEEIVEQPEAKTMDDTIRETLEKINARDSEEEPSRARDEKGRFAKAETPEEIPTEAPVEATETPVEAQTEEAPYTVPPELQKLGLRKDEAEFFQKNPIAMNALLRRSEEMQKGFEQVRGHVEFANTVNEALNPYYGAIKAAGVSPAQAIQSLFAAESALRFGTHTQKVQMIHKLAQDYGIDLGQVTEYQPEQHYVDPTIAQLQAQQQQLFGWIQQQNQAREQAELSALNSEIEKFKSDPKNGYFEEVREDMGRLLQAGLASNLQDAYDKAIYANPTVRSRVLAQQQEQARQEAARKAQEAKRAAMVNVPKRGTMPASKPVGTIEDTIRETAQRLGIM